MTTFARLYTQDELAALLNEIDKELQRRGISIPYRPLKAMGEIAKRSSAWIPIMRKGTVMQAGIACDGTAEFISAWYTERYGDRTKVDLSPGDAPFLIRGEAYKFRVPYIFGTVRFIVRPLEMGTKSRNLSVDGTPLMCNLLGHVSDLTSAFARELTQDELHNIHTVCMSFIQDYNDIEHLLRRLEGRVERRLLFDALGDLRSAVGYIFDRQRRYGQTRWLALQAVEKILKAYLVSRGLKPKMTHDLNALIAQFGVNFDRSFFEHHHILVVQCTSGIRYGEVQSRLVEAVDGWQTAMRMCAESAKRMGRELGLYQP